jgi:5-methylthioadenosine/S-adenosylhomocysteine deaminase
MSEVVDTLISGAKIITMDSQRRIFMDGALAIKGNKIVAVGQRVDIEKEYRADNVIDGKRFVITPGFINGHIHITGDPLTRNYVPEDIFCDPEEKLTQWVLPRYYAHSPENEKVSAKLACLEMLRAGITCFLEAGTIRHLDEVVEGVKATGIRGRVGIWVEGRAYSDDDDQQTFNDKAIALMEGEIERFPSTKPSSGNIQADQSNEKNLVSAWPLLIGHNTNTDEVWKAAKSLADANGLGVSAHMSPYQNDPDWFLSQYGCRPIEHLANIGVLGENVSLTHVTHIDEREFDILVETGTNVIFCPLPALKGVFGVTSAGRYPQMAAADINLMLGTDGYDIDILHSARLMAALFKDVKLDTRIFPAYDTLEMLTVNAAKAMGMQQEIGSLEVGKKADFVCHDIDRPEWRPLVSLVNQLIWTADGRGVHSVWVDGVRVIDNYCATFIDESELLEQVQRASEEVIKRSEIPFISPWPIL